MHVEDIYAALPTIETEHLCLRKLEEADLADLFAYASDPEVAKYVTWPVHKSVNDSKQYLKFILKQYDLGQIAPWGITLKHSNTLIGTIDFVSWNTAHHSAEIGYALARQYWGRGIVTEAAKALVDFGFKQMALQRIQARCYVENIGSARVMKKIGMQFEGIARSALYVGDQFHDVRIYAIIKEDGQKEDFA